MNITHEGTDIIGYYCMCIYFVLNKYYYIIILYGGSHASDILHVLMGVSVAKLIIYNIVLLFICHNKRSSSIFCFSENLFGTHLSCDNLYDGMTE